MSVKDVMMIDDELEKYLTMHNFECASVKDVYDYELLIRNGTSAVGIEWTPVIHIVGSGILEEVISKYERYSSWASSGTLAFRIVVDGKVIYEEWGYSEVSSSNLGSVYRGFVVKENAENPFFGMGYAFPTENTTKVTTFPYKNTDDRKMSARMIIPRPISFKKEVNIEMKHVAFTAYQSTYINASAYYSLF